MNTNSCFMIEVVKNRITWRGLLLFCLHCLCFSHITLVKTHNSQNFATSAKVAMAEFSQKRANLAITFPLGVKLCKVHICNIFALCKFNANSLHIVTSLFTKQGVISLLKLCPHGLFQVVETSLEQVVINL